MIAWFILLVPSTMFALVSIGKEVGTHLAVQVAEDDGDDDTLQFHQELRAQKRFVFYKAG
jgi:hypothetical protein